MEDFLAGPLFRYFLFPIGSAVLGIAVKCVTRNDRYTAFVKEDIAVGLQLMLTACLLFVIATSDKAIRLLETNRLLEQILATSPVDQVRANAFQAQAALLSGQIAFAGWVIALLLFSLWSVSTVVRKWGWKSESEMTVLAGITIPLGVGILSLIVVMAGATQ